DFDEEADAHLAAAHQIEQPQPGLIAEGEEDGFQFLSCLFHMRLDKYELRTHIHEHEYDTEASYFHQRAQRPAQHRVLPTDARHGAVEGAHGLRKVRRAGSA